MSEPTSVEISLDAPIARVTVLEDRAMVSRVAQLPPAQGQLRLVISHVSPLLVDKSLRASAPAGTRVLDVRCRRSLAPWQSRAAGDGGEPHATAHPALHHDAVSLAAAVDKARHEVELARAQLHSARDELGAHQQLRRAELEDLSAAATRGEVTREAAAELAARDDDARAYVERIAEAELLVGERELALRDAQELAARAAQHAGVEVARLELDCLSDAAGGELVLEYMVPAAAWRPFHRAQLVEAEGKAELSWEQGACIWQRTGEDWTGVALALSAERASLGVEPPALQDDLLDVRPKPHLAVSAREQEIEHVGLGEAKPPTAGEPTVMGVDDGGLGLLLEPAGACTIKSDGRPHRVALERFACEAELALLAIPLRSPLCHVRTRFANRATTPILSGPVDLVRRSGFIGRTDIDFVNAGERGELGFGGEPDVRVHREQHEDQEESSLLGGWTSKIVRVVIRLSNLGAQARQVTVCDRVPVSEIEQVVISVAGPEAYLLAKERRPGEDEVPQITARAIDPNGLVTWDVPLPPRGRAAVTLEYKIKSQRGVTGL